MIAEPKLRLILAIVLLTAIGHCAIVPNQFCWKGFYRREPVAVGKCQAGKQLFGFMCYEQCPASMPMTEFDCYKPGCPIGFTDQPTTCYQTYDRVWSWPIGYTFQSDQEAQAACERRFGRGGCITWFLSWRPKCKEGYENWWGGFCRYTEINCTAYGFSNPFLTSSPFCLKDSLFIVPSMPACPEGSQINGLSCYKPCKEGYQGVGPYCWRKSPKGMINCGVGSVLNLESCKRSQIPIDNVTFSFNFIAQVLLESYRLESVPQENKTAAATDYLVQLRTSYQAFMTQLFSYNPSDPKGQSELFKYLLVKQSLPQYKDSMNAVAYIMKATGAIPNLQMFSFMLELVSLVAEGEITKMMKDTNLPVCSQ